MLQYNDIVNGIEYRHIIHVKNIQIFFDMEKSVSWAIYTMHNNAVWEFIIPAMS